jgi:1,2-diacylglycerol 3-alpha-glucosyltransferase
MKIRREKTLLYVGRLEEYKGVQYIIQSLPELQEFRLKVVGKGPYEDELRDIANNLGVAQKVDWLKDISREKLLDCHADADIFLMLSSYEAYGITFAEELASGTPCMVAKGSALEEFVDGENCIGIDNPVSKDKVIKVMKDLEKSKLAKDHDLKSVIDWNEVSEEIIKVYKLTI